jgi:hypothetical protein
VLGKIAMSKSLLFPEPGGTFSECGAATPKGIRQNRCQLIESATSRHNG